MISNANLQPSATSEADAETQLLLSTDESGRIEVGNDAFAAIYRVPTSEVPGREVSAFYAPGEIDRIRQERGDEARVTGRISTEVDHVRSDGSVFPVRVDAAHGKDRKFLVDRIAGPPDLRQADDEDRRGQQPDQFRFHATVMRLSE